MKDMMFDPEATQPIVDAIKALRDSGTAPNSQIAGALLGELVISIAALDDEQLRWRIANTCQMLLGVFHKPELDA